MEVGIAISSPNSELHSTSSKQSGFISDGAMQDNIL